MPDEVKRSARQSCDGCTENIIIWNTTDIIVKKELSLIIDIVSYHWLTETKIFWSKTSFRNGSFASSFNLRMTEVLAKLPNQWKWYCDEFALISQRSSKAPIMREEAQGQPSTQKHCFSSHRINWLLRDFSSLGDTVDMVKIRNNGNQTATQQMWKAPVAGH